jgi:hypothetical protein
LLTCNPGLSHQVDDVDVHTAHVQPLQVPAIGKLLVDSREYELVNICPMLEMDPITTACITSPSSINK